MGRDNRKFLVLRQRTAEFRPVCLQDLFPAASDASTFDQMLDAAKMMTIDLLGAARRSSALPVC
jgi:hypothetical protein